MLLAASLAAMAAERIEPTSAEVAIEFSGVTKRFSSGQPFAVEELNLQIRHGELVVFVGPSGCEAGHDPRGLPLETREPILLACGPTLGSTGSAAAEKAPNARPNPTIAIEMTEMAVRGAGPTTEVVPVRKSKISMIV